MVHFPTAHACEQESFTLLLDRWDVIPMLKILGLIVPCAFFFLHQELYILSFQKPAFRFMVSFTICWFSSSLKCIFILF